MVVTRYLPHHLPWCAALLLLLTLSPLASQEAPPIDQRTRVGIGVSDQTNLEGVSNRLYQSVMNVLASAHPEALFFRAPAQRFFAEQEPDLEAAEEALYDLLLRLTVERIEESEGYTARLDLYDVRGESLLTTIQTEIEVDRLGRYLRAGSWELAVSRLGPHIEAYRPLAELTVQTEPGARVLLEPGDAAVAGSEGNVVELVRTMRSYSISVELDGYRSEETTVYVGREPTLVTVELHRYPRWTVDIALKEGAFPGPALGRYLGDQRYHLAIGVTTHLIGFTPLRQLSRRYAGDPGLVTSIPTSELKLRGKLLLRSRDHRFRPSLGIGAFGSFVHGEGHLGIDPILPGGLLFSLGAVQELSQRLYATLHVGSRLYVSSNSSLTLPYTFFYRLNDTPLYWLPAVLSFGGRIAL